MPSMSPTPKAPIAVTKGEKFQTSDIKELKSQPLTSVAVGGEETKKKTEKPMPSPRLKRSEFVKEPTPEDIAALGVHAPVLEQIEEARIALNSLSEQLSIQVSSVDGWEKQLKVRKIRIAFFDVYRLIPISFFVALRRVFDRF